MISWFQAFAFAFTFDLYRYVAVPVYLPFAADRVVHASAEVLEKVAEIGVRGGRPVGTAAEIGGDLFNTRWGCAR